MRRSEKHTICRLCLTDKVELCCAFQSNGIPGWTAADAIKEFLRLQVSEGDIYPQCVCIECMLKLEDFKLFQQQCERNKDILDRAYSGNGRFGGTEDDVGIVFCSNESLSYLYFKEEDLEVPSEKDPLELSEAEHQIKSEISNDCKEISSGEVIGSSDQVSCPVKFEYEEQVVKGPCEKILYSEHGEKEGVLDIKADSCSNGSFEEDISRGSEAELKSSVNDIADFSKETEGCSYMRDNSSDAHPSKPQNDIRGHIGVSRLPGMEDIIENEEKVTVSNPISSDSKGDHSSYNASQNMEPEKDQIMLGQCGDESVSDFETHEEFGEDEKFFKCTKCFKTFISSYDFRKHTLIHSGQNPIQDAECSSETMKGNGNHESHVMVDFGESLGTHTTVPTKKHSKSKEFSKSSHDMDNNNKAHKCTDSTDKPLKCDVCGKSFSQMAKLRRHVYSHLEKKPFECTVCDKTFCSTDTLKHHMIIHSGKRSFKCGECNKTFFYKSHLKSHMETHSGIKPYECTNCGKSFRLKVTLDIHMRRHSGERPYKCNECGKTFSDNSGLYGHSRIHSGKRPYECYQCRKSFYDKKYLKVHMRVHSGERPYKCKECGKSFPQSSTLSCHMKIHSGERPHKCDECGKSFTSKGTLREHMRVHSGERPYKCKECNASFTQGGSLNTHMRIHTRGRPYKCDECGESFSVMNTLKVHMRVHLGKRTYKCSECSKSFTQSSNLKDHMRVHTGERPYSCNQCSMSFRKKSILQNHAKIHSGKKPLRTIREVRCFSVIQSKKTI